MLLSVRPLSRPARRAVVVAVMVVAALGFSTHLAAQSAVSVVPGGPYTGTAGVPLLFNGSASQAPAGDSLIQFTWDFGDGSAPGAGAIVQKTYSSAGSFTARLTVITNKGLTATATTSVVIGVGQAPVVTTPLVGACQPVLTPAGFVVSACGAPSVVPATVGCVPTWVTVGGVLTQVCLGATSPFVAPRTCVRYVRTVTGVIVAQQFIC